MWEVRGQEDESNNSLDVAMFHRKSNLARKHSPLGYRIQYQPDPQNARQTIPQSMVWLDPTSVEEFVERMGTNDRIFQLIKKCPATEENIINDLGLSRGTVTGTLSRLKNAGKAYKKDNLWGLVNKYV